MTPLATYSESRFMYSRDFQLYEDKIHIHIKDGLNTTGDMDIMLNRIDPNPAILNTRNESKTKLVLFISIACFIVPFLILSIYEIVHVNNLAYVALVGLTIVLLVNIYFYVFSKRILINSFPIYGSNGELNIGKYGKEINKYDEFINLLINQINKSKK